MPPLPAKKAAPAPVKAAAKKVQASKKAAPPAKKVAPPRSNIELPPQIVPIGYGVRTDHPKILIYGEPGTGKTSLAATAPNALMFEADRGEASAAMRGSTAKKWPVKDWDDLYEGLRWVESVGYKVFDWIILDTITMFQDRGMDQIMDDLVAAKPHRQVWAPDKGEFGQNMNRLMRWVRDFIELPCGLIVTAHSMMSEDSTGESRYMPAVQGKNMAEKVCGRFDIVGHLSTRVVNGREVPRFSTLKEEKYYAKDRYNGKIGAIVDPTIAKIIRRIEKPDTAEASSN